MPTYETYLVFAGDGEEETVDIEVEYAVNKPRKGMRDSLGVPLEPDDPFEIEIIKVVRCDNRQEIELTSAQSDDVIATILDNVDFNSTQED